MTRIAYIGCSLAALATLLCPGEARAARNASFRIGVQVVSSARLVASASGAGLGLASGARGGRGAALLVEQRSGAPVQLRDGSRLPQPGEAPLVVPAGGAGQLAFAPGARQAEVVVTLFPDGAPPAL
jgi:hypothetical protein